MSLPPDERKAAWILAGIAAAEGTWCYFNLRAGLFRFMDFMGFVHGGAGFLGWLLALLATAIFLGYSVQLPSVRANLFADSRLKLLGLAVAITAAFCEEAIFRKLVMNGAEHAGHGSALQILASALTFGIAHGVWGAMRGSFGAALGAVAATSVLGAMLAVVYIASHRVLAPCIVAHFVMNAFAEPGLVLAAVRGEFTSARRGLRRVTAS